MDIEQKLELIQQMHREQEENEFQDLDLQTSWSVSFRFRLLVAVLLFLCFFIMDTKGIVYGNINSSKIMEYVESNMRMEELKIGFDEISFEKFYKKLYD